MEKQPVFQTKIELNLLRCLFTGFALHPVRVIIITPLKKRAKPPKDGDAKSGD